MRATLNWFSKLSFSLASALLVKEFLTITLAWLISRRMKEGKWKKREDCRRGTARKLNYIQKSIFRSQNHVGLFETPWLHHFRLPCPSLSPRLCSNSCALSWWCYLTILSSTTSPFCLQSYKVSESFSNSRLFASGGQSIGASASASVLPMNIQGWFCLGLAGLNSLLSRVFSRVFSNTTVQNHQFFGTQLSL